MSVEEEHAGVQEGMERSGWGNIPSRESEKVLERSYRSDEGTGEETGMLIPSRKVRKCLKEATEEMTRV